MKLDQIDLLITTIKQTSKTTQKISILNSFLKNFDISEIKYLLFCIDSKHPLKKKIGLSKGTIIKILCKLFKIEKSMFYQIYAKTSIDLIKIWQSMVNQVNFYECKNPELKEIWNFFNELAILKGKGSSNLKIQKLTSYLLNLDDKLSYLIIMFFTNEKRFGADLKLFFKAISNIYNLSVKTLEKNYIKIRLNEQLSLIDEFSDISLFSPIKCMLANPYKQTIFKKLIKQENYISEIKYDGIRAQIHYQNGKIEIFSRNLQNLTNSLKDFIYPYFEKCIDSIILDVEIIGLDFQILSTIFRRKHKLNLFKNVDIDFKVFDILYYNKSLLLEPLHKRKYLLHELLQKLNIVQKGVLYNTIENTNIRSLAEQVYKTGFEGLILKDLNSIYLPGERTNKWIKVKPEFETGDFVIKACLKGHGMKNEYFTSLLLGVKDKNEIKEIGFVGSGFKIDDLNKLKELLLPLIIEQKDDLLVVKPTIVIEVKFQGIQKSETYNSLYSLRFPVFKAIRYDKDVNQINTLDEIIYINEIYKK